MSILQMPPDLVIRPAGVWDTRAPFHPYLSSYKQTNRTYSLTVLAALRTQRNLAELRKKRPDFSYRTFFAGSKKKRSQRSASAWVSYKLALGRKTQNEFKKADSTIINHDLEAMITSVRQHSLLAHVAAFERFAAGYTLNYLLAKLESDQLWTNEERLLATKLSPMHGGGASPSVSFFLRCLPRLRSGLADLAPYFRDPVTKEPAIAVGRVSALETLRFWIAVRNLIVHNGGWISTRFAEQHRHLWDRLFEVHKFIPTLKPGRPMFIYHQLVRFSSLTFYKSALWMTKDLVDISAGRSGSPFSPDSEPEGFYEPPIPKPLLIEGDHEMSYRFANDEQFRLSLQTGW